MMTQGEMEAAVCEGISRFEQEYMGRGPKEVRCFLIDDLLLVRLQGVLTAAAPCANRGTGTRSRSSQRRAYPVDRDRSPNAGVADRNNHRGENDQPASRYQHHLR